MLGLQGFLKFSKCQEDEPVFLVQQWPRIGKLSANKAAITLFASLLKEHSALKEQLSSFNRLIITVISLGGSMTSVCTLWLLDNIILLQRIITSVPLASRLVYPFLVTSHSRTSIMELIKNLSQRRIMPLILARSYGLARVVQEGNPE
ncbi:uncharacterized protein LOC129901182 [Solanum dulcamara]|uniref:uncharacterized protein LOC129901182 n=1 Tax=Solanum dulcamara TaxID=45834 RepID=UPI002485AC6C|nr:uncharacterized protein LOC129901182 [Solanum dulcamara]